MPFFDYNDILLEIPVKVVPFVQRETGPLQTLGKSSFYMPSLLTFCSKAMRGY